MAGVENGPAKATIEGSNTDPAVTVVSIGGELDLSNVPGVEQQVDELLATRTPRVVFDLSAITFMDSSGIAMLLRVAERVGPVELRNPSHPVQLVIRATGLDEVFGLAT